MSAENLISEANQKAVDKMTSGRPVLVDIKPAIDVVPDMKKDLVLHAGPPITWDRMTGSFKGAIVGALMYEGLAKDWEEAESKINRQEITFDPCHNHHTVGSMSGITTASMPMFVIENKEHGNFAYSNIREERVKALRYGFYGEETTKNLQWIEKNLAPVLQEAVKIAGGLDMKTLLARAFHMGDDGHNENTATTSLLATRIMPHLLKTGFDKDVIHGAAKWMAYDERFSSTATFAACKANLDPAHNIKNSSIVTTMCRNGTDFGIRVSGLGDEWFTAPSTQVDALYFPGFTVDDASLDMGDSCVTETAGIGAFIMAAAPSMVQFVGGTAADVNRYTEESYEITFGENPSYTLPTLDFKPAPAGIDVIKVVKSGIAPIINTSIAHKEAGIGQVGAGMTRAPIECFKKALEAIVSKISS
tara:strand:- start:429 stop:1682 length:1254 start_codon:yes stop_codon:yes gene_type:complete